MKVENHTEKRKDTRPALLDKLKTRFENKEEKKEISL